MLFFRPSGIQCELMKSDPSYVHEHDLPDEEETGLEENMEMDISEEEPCFADEYEETETESESETDTDDDATASAER